MTTLNIRIKERRQELGMTLLEVATQLGVKEATMQRYESGEIKVQPEEISEAKWFKKDQLPSIPPAGSVAHNLITGVFD